MLNDPLFIKTQNELKKWRENKKTPRDHIPMSIKDNIRKLNFQYSKSKLRSSLELSGCSLNFLKETKIKTLPESAQFIELSAKTKIAEKDKTSSKIELDLPLGITLRIFI